MACEILNTSGKHRWCQKKEGTVRIQGQLAAAIALQTNATRNKLERKNTDFVCGDSRGHTVQCFRGDTGQWRLIELHSRNME